MRRSQAISVCSILCWLSLLAFSFAAEPTSWLEIHSNHFTVITDAGEKKGREVALRFEQMRAVFANLLGKDRLHQSVPLTILALNNDKSYYQVAPLRQGQPIAVPGFFVTGADQDFIVLNLFEPESWRAVAHDFAAMLLHYNYPPAQGWFDEGLSEYFSSIRVDNRHVELGTDPELLPSTTQDLLGNKRDIHAPKSLTELLGAQVWLSLPDLFTVKHDPWARNEGSRHTMYYAESWIVMHYLLHEQKLPETGAYMDLVLNQHLPVEEAIQKAYGMSATQMEQVIKDYFRAQTSLLTAVEVARQNNPNSTAGPGQAYSFPVPVGPDDSAITSKPLPEPDARAYYFEVALRVPERRENGLRELHALAETPTAADKKQEAKKPPTRVGEDPDQLPASAIGNPLAHRVLGWDHIEHAEFAEASAELKDAATINPSDMWVRYYISVLKYRMAQAQKGDIQGLANMMLDLRNVLEWYPEFADAYDLLAVARNSGGGPAAALQAERAAIGLSPRDDRYAFHLAQIYVTSKKWDAANSLLDRLKGSADPQIVAQARELIDQAGTERRYGIPASAGSAAQPKFAPQKSPFDVLEEDAAKRAAAAETESSAPPPDTRPGKFSKGRLLSVDCSQSPSALLMVSVGGSVLRLLTSDYKSLLLIGADNFSCDWKDRQVTVNYKPRGARDGDLISLEVR